MPVALKKCQLAVVSRTLAAWVVVVLAASYSARSSQAGVIVGDEQIIGAMAAMGPLAESHAKVPKAPPMWSSLLVSTGGQTGSGFGTSSTGSPVNASSTSAVAATVYELSPPELASAILAEGAIFFRAPPVFELLRPPKA